MYCTAFSIHSIYCTKCFIALHSSALHCLRTFNPWEGTQCSPMKRILRVTRGQMRAVSHNKVNLAASSGSHCCLGKGWEGLSFLLSIGFALGSFECAPKLGHRDSCTTEWIFDSSVDVEMCFPDNLKDWNKKHGGFVFTSSAVLVYFWTNKVLTHFHLQKIPFMSCIKRREITSWTCL